MTTTEAPLLAKFHLWFGPVHPAALTVSWERLTEAWITPRDANWHTCEHEATAGSYWDALDAAIDTLSNLAPSKMGVMMAQATVSSESGAFIATAALPVSEVLAALQAVTQ